MFTFGLHKLESLLTRKNPLLTTNDELVDIDEKYSLGSDDFMMAFALHSFNGDIKDFDSRFVRWIVRTW